MAVKVDPCTFGAVLMAAINQRTTIEEAASYALMHGIGTDDLAGEDKPIPAIFGSVLPADQRPSDDELKGLKLVDIDDLEKAAQEGGAR